jgi:hypothetical protein
MRRYRCEKYVYLFGKRRQRRHASTLPPNSRSSALERLACVFRR